MWRPAFTGFMVTNPSRHHMLYGLGLRAPMTRTGIERLIPESWMTEGVALVKGVSQQGCWAGRAGQAGLGGVSGPLRSHASAAAIVQGVWAAPDAEKRTAEGCRPH